MTELQVSPDLPVIDLTARQLLDVVGRALSNAYEEAAARDGVPEATRPTFDADTPVASLTVGQLEEALCWAVTVLERTAAGHDTAGFGAVWGQARV